MYYIILGTDAPASLERRMAVRATHLDRLNKLKDEGRLLLAGPMPAVDALDPGPAGFTGSLIVAEFDSLEEAQTWARADPYATEGVFTDIVVKPFRKTLP
jgi:uncharacterized protein YciI